MNSASDSDAALPRRTARRVASVSPGPDQFPPSLAGDQSLPYPAIDTQLSDLRLQIPGVRGCVLGGVDGLLITHNLPAGTDPNDLAAMAATTFGLGRQIGLRLGQGAFRQSTVRNDTGYLSVYAVSEQTLLAVVGEDAINVARLHLYAPGVAERLAELIAGALAR